MRFGKLLVPMIRVFFARGAGSVLGIGIAVLIANRLGAGASSDAFFLIRRVTLGLTEAFKRLVITVSIPPLVAMLRANGGKATGHGWLLKLAPLFFGLTGGTVLVAFLAGWIVVLLAPGFDTERHALAAELLRILAFTIPLHFMLSVLTSLSYAFRRYVAPELAALIPRSVTIVVLFLFVPPLGITTLGWTILAGTAIAALLMIPSVAVMLKSDTAKAFPPRDLGQMGEDRDVPAPTEPQIRQRALPAMILQIYRQASGWIDLAFASLLIAGAVTITEYGQRLAFLIPGLLMNSFFTVFYTEMAHDAVDGGVDRLRRSVAASLQAAMFVLVPFTLFLCVAARPLVDLLFQHGAFDEAMARQTVLVTQLFAPTVVLGFAMRALALGAYADADSPLMRVALAMVGLGLITRIPALAILPSYIGIAGIPAAILVSSLTSCVAAYYLLSRRWGNILRAPELLTMGKIMLASALAWLAMYVMASAVDTESTAGQLLLISVLAVAGAAIYLIATRLFGMQEARRFVFRLRRHRVPSA